MAEDLHNDFLTCIIKCNLSEIYNFLMKRQISNIMKLRGTDGYTALHFLASNNKYSTAEFLFRFCKDQYGPLFHAEVRDWVNETSYEERNTCTHLAVSRGNLVISN